MVGRREFRISKKIMKSRVRGGCFDSYRLGPGGKMKNDTDLFIKFD